MLAPKSPIALLFPSYLGLEELPDGFVQQVQKYNPHVMELELSRYSNGQLNYTEILVYSEDTVVGFCVRFGARYNIWSNTLCIFLFTLGFMTSA